MDFNGDNNGAVTDKKDHVIQLIRNTVNTFPAMMSL